MEMVFSSALLWKCTVCTSRPFICGNSTILWPGLPCSRKSNSLPGWAMVELFWVTGGFLRLLAGGFFMGGLLSDGAGFWPRMNTKKRESEQGVLRAECLRQVAPKRRDV